MAHRDTKGQGRESLESINVSLKESLAESQARERFLYEHLEKLGLDPPNFDECNDEDTDTLKKELTSRDANSFYGALFERASWLSGLLVLQSFSTMILSNNQHILEKHPTVIYFLTALVGAGGNAGNQASVRVIRGLALKTLTAHTVKDFFIREAGMAFLLALCLGCVGFLRAMLSPCTGSELVAVVVSLMSIVFISVFVGAMLPLLLHAVKVDPGAFFLSHVHSFNLSLDLLLVILPVQPVHAIISG